MTKAEVAQAVELAKQGNTRHAVAFEAADAIRLSTDLGRRYTHLTLGAVAALLSYQAMQLNSEWDMSELNQTIAWLKPKVLII